MNPLYRLLLHCYPPAFRARFGDELAGAFEAGLRASRARGMLPALRFAFTRLGDAVLSGLAERRTARRMLHPEPNGGASGKGIRWLFRDFRLACRTLRRQPSFSAVAVATLALGIGATAAVFSVADIVLLRPLPYASADRLVRVETRNEGLKISGGPASYPDFTDWRAARIFEDIGIYQLGVSVVRFGDASERVRSAAASASMFSTLGVQPTIGRLPTAEEDRPGVRSVVLLTDSVWRRRYGSDPGILTRSLMMDGKLVSIIGVLPGSFQFEGDPEFWTPFGDDGDVTIRVNRYLNVIARLPARGVTHTSERTSRCAVRTARPDVRGLEQRLERVRRALAGVAGQRGATPAPAAGRLGRPRAAHQLYERGDAADRPRRGPHEGTRGPRGSGRKPLAHRLAATDGEPRTVTGRRQPWGGPGGVVGIAAGSIRSG